MTRLHRTRDHQAPSVEVLIRRALVIARLAREHGNHPFGALLADAAARCSWRPRTRS